MAPGGVESGVTVVAAFVVFVVAMAFLGQDGWKSGLGAEALRKVQELEEKSVRLERDRAQKQMRLETVEQALDKQKQKVMIQTYFLCTPMPHAPKFNQGRSSLFFNFIISTYYTFCVNLLVA